MKVKQMELTAFGKQVKKRLIDKGMTQVELAALIGCNAVSVAERSTLRIYRGF